MGVEGAALFLLAVEYYGHQLGGGDIVAGADLDPRLVDGQLLKEGFDGVMEDEASAHGDCLREKRCGVNERRHWDRVKEFSMNRIDEQLRQELIAYLGGFVSDRRKERMEQVLAWRTRFLTVALEDLYQPHNASAVLRSCDCFGVQDVHVIENRNVYEVHAGIDMGASGWLDLHRYSDSLSALGTLKKKGYRLVAATPHRDDGALDELAVDAPLAVIFGTEDLGLSEQILEAADEYVRVPMYGFTESFNISVCAALVLRELTGRLHKSGADWGLAEGEKEDLRLAWYRRSVRGVELIEERFMAERGL